MNAKQSNFEILYSDFAPCSDAHTPKAQNLIDYQGTQCWKQETRLMSISASILAEITRWNPVTVACQTLFTKHEESEDPCCTR